MHVRVRRRPADVKFEAGKTDANFRNEMNSISGPTRTSRRMGATPGGVVVCVISCPNDQHILLETPLEIQTHTSGSEANVPSALLQNVPRAAFVVTC